MPQMLKKAMLHPLLHPFCSVTKRNRVRKSKEPLIYKDSSRADGRIRTGDLILTKDALYLLSYISTLYIAERRYYYTATRGKMQYLFGVWVKLNKLDVGMRGWRGFYGNICSFWY